MYHHLGLGFGVCRFQGDFSISDWDSCRNLGAEPEILEFRVLGFRPPPPSLCIDGIPTRITEGLYC